MRLKIRTKIILSFFAPIIPLTVIVVIVSGYLLNNLYNEAQRLNSISKERIKVADLSLSLNRVLMPVNDYIITGNKKYIEDFKAISIDVERGLKEAEEILPLIEEIEEFDGEVKVERDILKGVKDSWQNIREISLRIFAIPEPVGNKDAMRLMEEMDYKWGYPAIERLGRWREIDLKEYKDVLEKHNMAWHQLWITMTGGVILFLSICTIYIIIYSRIASRSEEKLKHSETMLKDAQRIAKLGSWEWNIILDQLVWSDELYQIFENDPRQFTPTNEAVIASIVPEDRPFVTNAVNESLTKGKPFDIEYRIFGSHQNVKWLHFQGELTFDHQNKPIFAKGTVQDITEQKLAEEKLREQLDELVRFQKVAVKREFRIRELQERVKEMEGRQDEGAIGRRGETENG